MAVAVAATMAIRTAPAIRRAASANISASAAAAISTLGSLSAPCATSVGARHRDAGILEADQREEESDSRRDGELETLGNGIDQPGARRRQRKDDEQDSRQEHAAQRQPPVAAQGRD